MGLNRFYTYNGQILKTAEGNPIGYEKILPPTDYLALYTFEADNLNDSKGTYHLSKSTNATNYFGSSYKKIGNSGLYTRPPNYGSDNAVYNSSLGAKTSNRLNYTILGWINLPSFTSGAGNTAVAQIIFCTTELENNGAGDYLALGNTINTGKLMIARHNTYSLGTPTISSETFTANSWNFYVLQYDGNNLNGFVNGQKVCTHPSTINSGTNGLYIGANGNGQNYSQGQIYADHIRFFDYALTEAQIAAIYEAEV